MTTWLIPPFSGKITKTPNGVVYTGTANTPVGVEDIDVAFLTTENWTAALLSPNPPVYQLRLPSSGGGSGGGGGAVSSVAGRTGVVTLASADITDATNAGKLLLTATDANAQKTLLNISGSSGLTSVAFSTAIDLSSSKLLAPTTISGPITFTTTGTPVAGNIVRVRLTANGTDVPVFIGFREQSNSAGFSNTANVVNIIDFIYDGVDYLTNIRQRVGDMGLVDTVAPLISSLAVTSATPTVINITANKSLQNITYLASSITVSGIASAPTVSSITYVDATHFNVMLSAAIVGADLPKLSYTQPGTSANQIKDISGNLLATFASATVTNGITAIATTALQLINHNAGTATESLVSSGYTYTTANMTQVSYVSGIAIATGKDGFVLMTVGAHTSNGVQLGIANASSVTNFNSANSSYSLNTSASAGYSALGSFGVHTIASTLNPTVQPNGGGITRNGTVSGTCATGDVIKYERKGSATTPYIEGSLSKDSGATFVVFETLTGTVTTNGFVAEGCNVTGAIYAWFETDASSATEVTGATVIVSGVKAYSAP